MDRRAQYYQQVQLLLQLLPYVAEHECFALKGGTAINLFCRNFPRLSVDIDLVFLPMMEREDSLRKALVVYIISHNRPISELLRPNFKDISGLYEGEFRSMAQEDVSLHELETTRERLVDLIHSSLTEQERQFLLTFKRCSPDWSLLGLNGVEHLPAVRWKLRNLKKMSAASHTQALSELERILQA
jgi:hypothetical protein